MSKKMLRPTQIYGRGNPIPVGRTKFWGDYVYNQEIGGEQFIPGTSIPRLRLARIGERAVAGFEDEVDAVVELLRGERDRRPNSMEQAKVRCEKHHAEQNRLKAAKRTRAA